MFEPSGEFTVNEPARNPINEIRLSLGGEIPSKSLFEKSRPRKEWFLNPLMRNSLHGIGHEARVLVWQEILTRLLKIEFKGQYDNVDVEALRWAAVIHDTRKAADFLDSGHGERSAQWVSTDRF